MTTSGGSTAAVVRDGVGESPVAAVWVGSGEMRARFRAFDWAATSLGPVEAWSPPLQTAVALCLDSGLPTCIYIGPELRLVYNDLWRPWLGTAKHPAALGRPAREVWAEIWDVIAPQFAQVLAGGPPIALENQPFMIDRGRGPEETFFTYGLSAVHDAAGTVVAVHNVCLETTGRVRAERALTRLIAASPAVMAIYSGPDHVITYVNPTWERLVGKPSALGRTFRDVFPEMAETGIMERLDDVYATGERYTVEELPLPIQRRPDGPIEESFWSFAWEPTTLPDAAEPAGARAAGDGAPAREPTASGLGRDILCHAIDVTAQVLARRDVERLLADSERARVATASARQAAEAARAEAEMANQTKSQFLATMSHELRTPLNAIGGYAQLMELGLHGPVTPEQVTALGRIQRGQQHLLGLINSVLNYAKLEAGHVQYDTTDVPVAEALGEVAALVAPQARAKGISLVTALCAPNADGSLLMARADAEKVRQVLLNLLSNAVKFTRGGGTVTVGCSRVVDALSGVPRVALTVADTGRGIAADQLARVFAPFVQVDQRLTRTEEGTGLGLAISRDLARGMGGDLTVESAPGVGSTFRLTLPIGARGATGS